MDDEKKQFICPVCGKPYEFYLRTWQDENGEWHCAHDKPKSKDRLAVQRKLNEEASAYALKLANEARARDREENPMVTINPPPGEPGKKPLRVPKKVIEKIKEKVTPEIEKLL